MEGTVSRPGLAATKLEYKKFAKDQISDLVTRVDSFAIIQGMENRYAYSQVRQEESWCNQVRGED